MNRSILIVICDFLLVSLLAFSTVDINKVDQAATRSMSAVAAPGATNQINGRQDLGDVMRLALEDERKKQDAMALELSNTQSTASQQRTLLNQRDEQLAAYEQQLHSREEQAAQLREQQTNLLQQMTVAQSNIANLDQQLCANSVETLITKEQRDAHEADARARREEAAALRQKLADLRQSNAVVTAEREQLSSQLQLTEAQKQAATAQLARVQEDLAVQRQQNTNLAEGVKALAGQSSELTREIRENRPLAPNTIFNNFSTNRALIHFYGARPGFFGGEAGKEKETQTIVATDGTNAFALCHVDDTLLTLWNPNTPWDELTATVGHESVVQPLNSMSFYSLDPRIALMPVPQDWVQKSDCKAYRLAKDPFKFQDAIVIGAGGGYYGESKFQIDLSAPHYLKMDHNSLKGLFGKFNPSTGDLVFSQTGELLGVMANNTYCIVIRNFAAAETLHFGSGVSRQHLPETLSSIHTLVAGLPFKLQ